MEEYLSGKEAIMKITFMGAGSTIFAKNVLGDSLMTEALCEAEIALYHKVRDHIRILD